ncbi:MAG TPA: hypothetical protein DEP28_00575 [Bacteroidetes bacterium]|nr:hypothetical protein [Bacteroidota bacterium]
MKIMLLLIFSLTYGFVFAQKMPSDYFDEAIYATSVNDNKKAIYDFKYIVDNFPENELFSLAYFNLAELYFVEKQYDSAITIYKNILNNDFNDTTLIKADIMSIPFANFTYKSCLRLSSYYLMNNEFEKALDYLNLTTTDHKPLSDCANCAAGFEIDYALNAADIYLQMNKKLNAIQVLLKSYNNAFGSFNSQVEVLKEIFLTEKNVKNKLDQALKKVYKKETENNRKSFYEFYIKFYDVDIYLHQPLILEEPTEELEIEKRIARFKESRLYKMVSELKN